MTYSSGDKLPVDRDTIVAQLRAWLDTQPWYKRNANTVSGFVLGALGLAWWVTTEFTDLPHSVDVVIGALLFLALVLGLRLTPNGMTPELVEETVAKVDESTPPTTPPPITPQR